jgi:phosphocarrier protein HPr
MSELHSLTIQLQNNKGLHARASAKFVKTSEKFKSRITVARGSLEVSALSIMGLMMLVARYGTEITIHASGPDAERALKALGELVDNKFGEDV